MIAEKYLFPTIKVDYSHPIYSVDELHNYERLPDFALLPEDETVVIPMLEDLQLSFLLDDGTGKRPFTKEMLSMNPVFNEENIIHHAYQNLLQEIGDHISFATTEDGLISVTTGGNLEASLLLLSNFWDRLETQVGTELYAAIPAQDMLLAAEAGSPGAVYRLQQRIRNRFRQNDHAGLCSKAIYQRIEGRWTILATAF